MKVIGAGLPRTGTLSTRAAVEQLLGPCYHGATPMVERPEHMQFWIDALNREELDTEKTNEVLADYEAGLDLPFSGWYRELLKIYPDAKVLLTVRDPKRWYKSAKFLYYVIGTLNFHQPYAWFMSLLGLGQLSAFMQQETGGIETGCGQFPNGVNGMQNRALNRGEEASVHFFNEHIEEVKSCVPEHQLLVFNVHDGWEPLCEFLEVPIPDTPFPNINDANEVRFVFNTVRALTWMTILGLPALLAYGLSYGSTFLPLGICGTMWLRWGVGRLLVRAVKNQTDKSKQH